MREAARGAAFRLWPQLAAAALAIESRGLGAPSIPHLFARDLVRVAPTLNDDLLELYGRSEQVLANRYGFFGATEEFGPEIDWAPPRGHEWQVELHSLDYALDLALTFRISGDERYVQHLRYLLADWIASNPPGRSIGWTPLALARRIRNSILAADLCRESFEAHADFLQIFTSSLAQQVTYLAWQACTLEDRRVRLAASRALLLAGRTFSGGRGAELGLAPRALLSQALEDGPASFPDHPQPLRQFELAAACCDHVLFGNTDAQWAREALHGALETLEGMLHPDGTLPLFGREPLPPVDAVTTLFALGTALLGVPRWKSLAGDEFGILPYMFLGEAGKRQFDDLPHEPWHADSRLQSGSGIFRLGDGKISAMLITAQQQASSRDHRDWLSYELTACGQRTVVDSGIAALGEAAAEDDQAGARCHNVLLVDGSLARIDSVRGAQSFPVAARDGVQGLWLRALGDDHLRGYFLVEDRYWVVLDLLGATGTHRLESLVHLYPAFSLEVRDGKTLARSGAASVSVFPLSVDERGVSGVARVSTHQPGWYAPTPGTRYPSPTLTFEWDQAELPGIFGYIIDTTQYVSNCGCVLAASEVGIKLTLGGKEYSIKTPAELTDLPPPE